MRVEHYTPRQREAIDRSEKLASDLQEQIDKLAYVAMMTDVEIDTDDESTTMHEEEGVSDEA